MLTIAFTGNAHKKKQNKILGNSLISTLEYDLGTYSK